MTNIQIFRKPKKSEVDKVKDNLAEVIYNKRTQYGISQDTLANIAGVDRKTINRIENGHFSPNLDTLVRIFTTLNIKSQTIFEIK